jgi:2-furoyl-CoA dehydrogenase large subunit
VPGCRRLTRTGPDRYEAEVMIGIAGIRGLYAAEIALSDKDEPHALRLIGRASGALGHGEGEGDVTLEPVGDGKTRLTYRYGADIGGKVASIGQRMLGAATRLLIGEFFRSLERRIAPEKQSAVRRLWAAATRWVRR